MRPTVVVTVVILATQNFIACGSREQRSSSQAKSPFSITGSETGFQNRPIAYNARYCDGDITWEVLSQNMYANGENANFTFEESGTYIVQATCSGAKVSTQAITVNINPIPTPDQNPVPTPDNPPTNQNPVPTPKYPPNNPIPTPEYPPNNPIPTPEYPDTNPKKPIPPNNPKPPVCHWVCRC